MGIRKDRDRSEALIAGLSHLMQSGLGLTDALEALQDQGDRTLRSWCRQILAGLSQGRSLSAMLEGPKNKGDPMAGPLLGVAEEGGMLPEVLEELRRHQELRGEVRRKIGGALLYPAVVCTGILIAFACMGAFVLPSLVQCAASLGGDAPLRAREVEERMGLVRTLLAVPLLVATVGLPLSLWAWRHWPPCRPVLSHILFALPGIGTYRRHCLGRDLGFCLGILARNGKGLPAALGLLSRLVTDPLAGRELGVMERGVRLGRPLSVLMAACPLLPGRVAGWMALGEHSGRHGEVFRRIHRLCQSRVEDMVRRACALVEPGLTLVAGGFLVLFATVLVIPSLQVFGGMQ